ncbi:hypothetical protein Tco_0754758 [Tanacetum coccineum]
MDREVKSLKHSRIPLVKVRWNSKHGPKFTWEQEDYMKSKYPQLFVDRAVEPTTCVDIVWKLLVHQVSFIAPLFLMIYWGGNDAKWGSPAGIHGMFSGWYRGLASRKVTLGVSMAWTKGVTTRTLGNMWESKDLIEKKIDWKRQPKDGDGAWHIRIEMIDPDGEKFNRIFQSIPTTRKLSEKEKPSDIIDLEYFHDS